MATSRPIRRGEWLTCIQGHYIGVSRRAVGDENPVEYVRQEDFAIQDLFGQRCAQEACVRIFGVTWPPSEDTYQAAITNGTAPGLYVREGDDTSDWETYRQVLARRVEEAMAARRGGESGVDETATVTATATATRRDDEIRVGDVVEVVSCRSIDWTTPTDVGCGGRVNEIDRLTGIAHLESCAWLRLPQEGIVGLADVRKVTSPSPPTIVVANGSPMPDEEANSLAAAVAAEVLRMHDEVRRQMSSPLASGGDEVTIRHLVNPAPPAGSVRLQSRDFTTASVTEYLQSLGATHIHISRTLEGVPVIEVTGLLQQALDTARQNLPAGVQLRAAVPAAEAPRRITAYDRWSSNVPQSSPQPPPRSPTPPQPSRFSLLEIDVDAGSEAASPPQALKASVDLGALQAELRAEREAKRALAAAQTPPGRFNLLECDLPAVATAVPKRPVVSSPSPKPLSPVETITDLTAARSPLELARMLAGLDEELSTMMRQREAN